MGQLSENKPFETEVRFFISDIDAFKQQVDHLGAELLREYSFIDYYYIPIHETWKTEEKTLRIRTWRKPELPTAVWFTKQEIVTIDGFGFKRSLYPEGKVKLYEGSLGDCKSVLSDLGFKHAYTIDKKHGWVWQVKEHDLEFCIEDVDRLGWTGEFELDGTNVEVIKESIKRHKKLLQLSDEQLSSKPLASIFEEKVLII